MKEGGMLPAKRTAMQRSKHAAAGEKLGHSAVTLCADMDQWATGAVYSSQPTGCSERDPVGACVYKGCEQVLIKPHRGACKTPCLTVLWVHPAFSAQALCILRSPSFIIASPRH
jgi:hypothetical protein